MITCVRHYGWRKLINQDLCRILSGLGGKVITAGFLVANLLVVNVYADSRIVGKVIDENGVSVADARVYFAGTNVRTCTDNNGRYTLPTENKFVYAVRVQRTGYQPAEAVAVARPSDVEFSFVLESTPGKSYADCKVRPLVASKAYWDDGDDQPPAKAMAMLGGIVVDEPSGQLLRHVEITTSPGSAKVYTNSNGAYNIFTNLKSGIYQVTARREGYQPATARVRVFANSGKLKFIRADIVLSPGTEMTEGGSSLDSSNNQEQSAEGGSNLGTTAIGESNAEGGSTLSE